MPTPIDLTPWRLTAIHAELKERKIQVSCLNLIRDHILYRMFNLTLTKGLSLTFSIPRLPSSLTLPLSILKKGQMYTSVLQKAQKELDGWRIKMVFAVIWNNKTHLSCCRFLTLCHHHNSHHRCLVDWFWLLPSMGGLNSTRVHLMQAHCLAFPLARLHY